MDIMELGAIGELVGAIAVVLTLGYLARQVRLSALSTRYLATQTMVTNQAESNFLLSTSPALLDLFQETLGEGGFSRLGPTDQAQVSTFMVGFYLQNDFAYHQYVNGQLDPKMWKRMEKDIPVFLSIPGIAEWWERDKNRFTPEFVAFVDNLLRGFTAPENFPTMGRESAVSDEKDA